MSKNTVPEFKLSDDSRRVIKGILDSKTAETHGILNIDELGECLDAFGFTFDDEDVDFLKKHFDDNGDGELEVEELVNNIDVLNWHSLYGKRLMKEFKKIDFDSDGVIRYPEMLKVLTTRGPNPLPPKDARRLLDQLARKFDANFDGKFSYAEFVKIYMSDMLPYKNTLVDNNASSSDEEQPAARAQKDLRKRPSGLKKRQTTSNLNGAARGAAASSSLSSSSVSVRPTSVAPSVGRGGSTYVRPPPPQSGRRRPIHQSSASEDYPREGSSRPRSVWERLSQTKTPLQKRSTYH